MKSILPFTTATLAWMFYAASATETICTIGTHGSIFLPHQNHALIGHSFLNQSGTVRIKCTFLCWRHNRCLSFNHNDINGICQLNDASKEDFPDSFKQDDGFSYFAGSSNKVKPLREEMIMTTKREQETSQAKTTTRPLQILQLQYEPPQLLAPPLQVQQPLPTFTTTAAATTTIAEATTTTAGTTTTAATATTTIAGATTTTTAATITTAAAATTTVATTTSYVCSSALGMESGAITDIQITSSNALNDDYINYGPQLARFNGGSSWCGLPTSDVSWIQVDLGRTEDLYAIIVHGRNGGNKYVAHFHLSYSDDGVTWTDIVNEDGSNKRYTSNDSNVKNVRISVESAPSVGMIRSIFIRISPSGWDVSMCMRFELIGCGLK